MIAVRCVDLCQSVRQSHADARLDFDDGRDDDGGGGGDGDDGDERARTGWDAENLVSLAVVRAVRSASTPVLGLLFVWRQR